MAEQVIKKNNVTIRGNKQAAETILFGHGFGINQTTFAEVTKPFEKDYRIILYDNVGNGQADIEAYSHARYKSLNGYVADLLDICKALELKNVIYVGHSVSGMVGLLASLQHPEYFSKIILLGASPRYLNDDEAGYIGGFNQEALDGFYEAMRGNFHAWASGFSALAMQNADRPQLAQAFAKTLEAMRPDIALGLAKAIFESDVREHLEKVTTPTLIVQTTNDIAVPMEVGIYLHQNIPGSRLTHVDTHGHFPHISAPAEVIIAVSQFI